MLLFIHMGWRMCCPGLLRDLRQGLGLAARLCTYSPPLPPHAPPPHFSPSFHFHVTPLHLYFTPHLHHFSPSHFHVTPHHFHLYQ
mmetsp:Transcript_17693/g.29322  ORF Transcript_17693/g.29322 Transcript_17693/m.29322 type:complete len:85 (-) Transcript_17693:393-647(-)